MSANEEMETDRDRYVREWLSRSLRRDDSRTFEASDGTTCCRNAQGRQRTRNKDYHRGRSAHGRGPRESCPRQEFKADEHRDKRLCAERPEITQSLSNGPYCTPDRLALDTPFRQIERQRHIQQLPTTLHGGQQNTIPSSPIPHVQKWKLHKARDFVNPTSRRGNPSEVEILLAPAALSPVKGYGRRPRHKTRLDRYEPKDTAIKARKSANVGKKEKQKPKKERRLSKAGIAEQFKAPNIKQDRLTITTKPGFGLFRNGKASSPKRRRDLPDLSFSEMGFLAKRKDRESQSPRNQSSGKGISQYFPRQPPIDMAYSAEPDKMRTQRRHISSRACSTPGVSQTAGFRATCQSKIDSSSGTKRHTRSRDSLTSLRARENKSDRRALRAGNTNMPTHDEQNTELSTTYYTWSASDRRVSEPRPTSKQLSQRTGQEDTQNYSPHLSVRDDNRATNTFGDKADAILSQNTNLACSTRGNCSGKDKKYLSLEDLHHLADKSPGKPDIQVSRIDMDAIHDKSSLNNKENKNEVVRPLENASGPCQAMDGDRNPTVTAVRNVISSPVGSWRYSCAEATNPAQGISDVKPPGLRPEHNASNGVARNEQQTETSQPRITQAHGAQMNNNCGILPPKKEIERSNPCTRQFLGVGTCGFNFWAPSTKEKVSPYSPAVSMSDDCFPRMEIDETRLDDFQFDISGLDEFDREVLETGRLNQTVQAEDNLDVYSFNGLSYHPLLVPGTGDGMPSLLGHNVSPCLSDEALFHDPQVQDSDVRLPVARENNHQGTKALTHTTLPPTGLFLHSFGENRAYKHDCSVGHGRSTPTIDVNSEYGFWGPSSWQQRHEFGGRAVERENSRGVSQTTATSNERRNSVGTDMKGEEHGPAAFWRPNRLY